MDKKIIAFKRKENVVVDFNGQEIEVIPFIDAPTEAILIEEYCQHYFNPESNAVVSASKYDYLGSELGQKASIIDRMTNVSLKNEDGTDIDLIEMLASGVFDVISNKIENYDSFQWNLNYIVKSIEREIELSKSLGTVVDGFAEKISGFLKKLSELSPDEIKNVGEQGSALLKEIESSPAASLFVEAGKSQKVQ